VKKTYLSIAGFNFEVVFNETEYLHSKNLFIHDFIRSFKGFICTDTSVEIHFKIYIYQKNEAQIYQNNKENFIEFFSTISARNELTTYYTISIQQFSLLLRYSLQVLLKDKGFFMHGACSIFDNQATLFLGESGKGKSTILKLTKNFTTPFADDIFIIREIEGHFKCFQSPIFDKQDWIKKQLTGYPIRSIFFLEHSNYFGIEGLKREEILEVGLKQVVYNISTRKFYLDKYFKFIEAVGDKARRLCFRKKEKRIKELFQIC
jgi:hypothetical protein